MQSDWDPIESNPQALSKSFVALSSDTRIKINSVLDDLGVMTKADDEAIVKMLLHIVKTVEGTF